MTFVDPAAEPPPPQGFDLFAGALCEDAQRRLMGEVLVAMAAAPPYRPLTPGGGRMSVAITSLGDLGWTSDARGYRYVPRHPLTDAPWPPLPASLLTLWRELGDANVPPDSCLVNLYRPGARMGLHQDRDEADPRFPVISISLGASAVFRLGGRERRGPTRAYRLDSGDVCRLAGAARLAFHGIDRLLEEDPGLVPGGGRVNLTLRRAAPV
jgi:alkylated DNA repair protein (DNA oxidative demethylase)